MDAEGFDVVVHFSEAVPGVHPIDGRQFRADRHVVRGHQLLQDASETRLMAADGTVVATWPTALIERIEWKPMSVATPGHGAGPLPTRTSDPGQAPRPIGEVAPIPDTVEWLQPMTLKIDSPPAIAPAHETTATVAFLPAPPASAVPV